MKYYLKALQNYATFKGRASRSEYWYFVLFNVIFSIVLGFVSGIVDLPILYTIYSLVLLIPSIAVAVRRMHDVGKSGWFILYISNLFPQISKSNQKIPEIKVIY